MRTPDYVLRGRVNCIKQRTISAPWTRNSQRSSRPHSSLYSSFLLVECYQSVALVKRHSIEKCQGGWDSEAIIRSTIFSVHLPSYFHVTAKSVIGVDEEQVTTTKRRRYQHWKQLACWYDGSGQADFALRMVALECRFHPVSVDRSLSLPFLGASSVMLALLSTSRCRREC